MLVKVWSGFLILKTQEFQKEVLFVKCITASFIYKHTTILCTHSTFLRTVRTDTHRCVYSGIKFSDYQLKVEKKYNGFLSHSHENKLKMIGS